MQHSVNVSSSDGNSSRIGSSMIRSVPKAATLFVVSKTAGVRAFLSASSVGGTTSRAFAVAHARSRTEPRMLEVKPFAGDRVPAFADRARMWAELEIDARTPAEA